MKVFEIPKLKVWLFTGGASWHMVTLPEEIAEEINVLYSERKMNFGTIQVEATINNTSWSTSIFTDTKSNSFVLPIKALVRKKEEISDGSIVDLILKFN